MLPFWGGFNSWKAVTLLDVCPCTHDRVAYVHAMDQPVSYVGVAVGIQIVNHVNQVASGFRACYGCQVLFD